MIRSGKQRKRFEVYSLAANSDAFGGEAKTYAEVPDITLWGSVEVQRGTEMDNAGRTQEVKVTRIRMRYWSGMDSTKRLCMLPLRRKFEIDDVENVGERNREMLLTVKEVC